MATSKSIEPEQIAVYAILSTTANLPAGHTRPVPTNNGKNKLTISNPDAIGGFLVFHNPNGIDAGDYKFHYPPNSNTEFYMAFDGNPICCYNDNADPSNIIKVMTEIAV